MPSRSRRRPATPYYVLFGLVLLLVGGGVYAFWPRSGLLQISVTPPDARVDINGVNVPGPSPFLVKQRAGVYQLAVSRPGYLGIRQAIQISAHQRGRLRLALKPSPQTILDLSSTPPGIPVWLDGKPLVTTKDGRQARTDLHAAGIAPGRHVVELSGAPSYLPWRMEIYQDPDRTLRLHAELVPAQRAVTPQKTTSRHRRRSAGVSSSQQRSSSAAASRKQASGPSPSKRLAVDPFEDSSWRDL
jgi:hypothetical protein